MVTAPVKIAYLINQYPQASQSFIRREINALEAQGVRVDRYTLRTWDQEVVDPGDRAEKQKTRVVLGVGAVGLLAAILATLFTRPGKFFRTLRLAWTMGHKGDRGRLYHLIYLAEACVLRRWLAATDAQHVHAHFGTNSTTVAMLVHALGGPTYSFTCHGPEEFDRPEALKLGEKIARARFVVAVSEYGRSQLYRWCAYEHWKKIKVIHCGVDMSFLTANPAPLADTPRLVCVGRFAEGLPVVVMEALALERPVLSTFVAGIPELVESAKSGYLVPAGSVDGLAAAMKEVLSAPVDELREMGRAGARRVSLQHDARIE